MILGICHLGLEKLAAQEIEHLTGAKCTVKKGAILFDTDSENVAKAIYRSQTILGAMLLETPKDKTFAVRAIKVDSDAPDVEAQVGAEIANAGAKVDLDDPEVKVIAYVVGDKRYVGIDLYGFDPSKRDYRAQTTPGTLKSTIYANILWFAGYDGETLLDPFGQSGCIPIEAALMSAKRSPNHYRKDEFTIKDLERFDNDAESKTIYCYDRLVNKAKTNAKLAGVNKMIKFGSVTVRDLDVKFGEHDIGLVVTQPPQMSKYADEKKIGAIYNEIFYQSRYILKGNVCLIALNSKTEELMKKNAEKHKFHLKDRMSTKKGDSTVRFLKFEQALNKEPDSKKP